MKHALTGQSIAELTSIPDNSDYNRVVVKQKATRTKSVFTANIYIDDEFFIDDYDPKNIRLLAKKGSGFSVLNAGTLEQGANNNIYFITDEGRKIVVGRSLSASSTFLNSKSPVALHPPIVNYPNFVSSSTSNFTCSILFDSLTSGFINHGEITYKWYEVKNWTQVAVGRTPTLSTLTMYNNEIGYAVIAEDSAGNVSPPSFLRVTKTSDPVIDYTQNLHITVTDVGNLATNAPATVEVDDIGVGFNYEFKIINYFNDFNYDFSVSKNSGVVTVDFFNPLVNENRWMTGLPMTDRGYLIVELKISVSSGIHQYFYFAVDGMSAAEPSFE